jgi:hypothetical protein
LANKQERKMDVTMFIRVVYALNLQFTVRLVAGAPHYTVRVRQKVQPLEEAEADQQSHAFWLLTQYAEKYALGAKVYLADDAVPEMLLRIPVRLGQLAPQIRASTTELLKALGLQWEHQSFGLVVRGLWMPEHYLQSERQRLGLDILQFVRRNGISATLRCAEEWLPAGGYAEYVCIRYRAPESQQIEPIS